jgi:hypothetical protein
VVHLFIASVGAPFEGEETTTLLRLVAAAVAAGLQVTVWCCRGSTLLTQSDLGPSRMRNLLEVGTGRVEREYPTTAALVEELIRDAAGRLRWLVCSHCIQERGATHQVPSVKVLSPIRYFPTLRAADVSLVLGAR